MKASLVGELLLLVGLLALAYLLYVQQEQLTSLELELDKVRGGIGATLPPVPVASDNGPVEQAAAPRPRQRKPRASGAS